MRFGLFIMGTRSGSYRDILEQVCRAEDLGFDAVLLAERHFGHGDLLYPSPFAMAAAIAARTRRIRIGTAARILPLQHPLHVAEEAATLDILSGGRLDFGVTRASLDEQCHAVFASPVDESRGRFEEALDVITRAWTLDRFAYDGRHYRIPEITVAPKPVQSPHPPIYLVTVSPETIRFAGRKGYSAYMPGTRSLGELKEASRTFWHSYEEAGHRSGRNGNGHAAHGGSNGNGHAAGSGNGRYHPRPAELSINRFVYVADSDRTAKREVEVPFMEFIDRRAPDLRAALVRKYGAATAFSYERFRDDFCLFGSPATVATRLAELRDEVGAGYVLCSTNLITLDHATCVRSMDLLAREVIPTLTPPPPPEQQQLPSPAGRGVTWADRRANREVSR